MVPPRGGGPDAPCPAPAPAGGDLAARPRAPDPLPDRARPAPVPPHRAPLAPPLPGRPVRPRPGLPRLRPPAHRRARVLAATGPAAAPAPPRLGRRPPPRRPGRVRGGAPAGRADPAPLAGPGRAGRGRPAAHESLRHLALQLRRLPPGWGAGRLRVALAGSAAAPLPAERTLRRWLAQAAPGPGGGPRRPPAAHGRARQPHEVWQMDAKEHIRLLHGECSWLRLVDESTGDIMWREVFPCGGLA